MKYGLAILESSIALLIKVFQKMRQIDIELMRVSEVASVLMLLGMKKDEDMQRLLGEICLTKNCNSVGEIISILAFLPFFPEKRKEANELLAHVLNNRNIDGGIGRFVGDRSRIPVSWKLLECAYYNNYPFDIHIQELIKWMESEWSKDMARGGLSYKCAGVLLAHSYYPYFSREFISKTIFWLLNNQNEDGGWGPQKNSPAGSIPSDTALALRALLNYRTNEVDVNIKGGVDWLIENRLKNGFWKEHPVEKPLMHASIFFDKYLKS